MNAASSDPLMGPGSPGAAAAAPRGRGPSGSRRAAVNRSRRRQRGLGISLNLTPMIDVVFLLLFFFLVVTRFGTPEGMLPARLPAEAAATAFDIPRTPLRVRFLADPAAPETCQVSIDRFADAPMPMTSLLEAFRRIRASHPGFDDPDTPVHLLAGDDVLWDHVVNAFNAGLAAGYEKIYFVVAP